MNVIRTLSAVFLLGLCNLATAQVEQIERRVYARLLTMRAQLLSACLDAEPDLLQAIAKDLVSSDARSPQEVITVAMQRLRGGEMEGHARFRAHLVPIVQPVVVDQKMYDGVHVTPYLARKGIDIKAVVFDCVVRDAKGKVVSSMKIDKETGTEDLLRFRATAKLSLRDLPAGRYQVEVRCIIGGEDPKVTLSPMQYDIDVLSGFKQRADRFPFVANPRAKDAWERQAIVDAWHRDHAEVLKDPLRRAVFFGVTDQVRRVYRGEPRLPCSDPLKDLEAAEQVLQTLDAFGAPTASVTNKNEEIGNSGDLLAGLSGRLVIGLPVGKGRGDSSDGSYSLVSLDLSARDQERPLVLVVPGSPTWDHRVQRPSSPRYTEPNWMLDQLRRVGFDSQEKYHLAIMESPGRYRSAPAAVAAVCRQLQKILSVRPGAVVLVGEREGAYAVARAVLADHDLAQGCVVACGGAMSRHELEGLKQTRVLVVAGTGHGTSKVLASMESYAKAMNRPLLVTSASDGVRPWLFALPMASSSIERFVQSVTAVKKTSGK